ncbi:unnamed protein product [Protopolystoma xenopodis]|uniref:Ig-like domain-containing protein n=1 Tax=Protopolystoma xenopodis TaxID=117903 RepID=A0A3S4ZQ59_9PLAT|nr:unnamed protein product [Protopolystoma xenopodis]
MLAGKFSNISKHLDEPKKTDVQEGKPEGQAKEKDAESKNKVEHEAATEKPSQRPVFLQARQGEEVLLPCDLFAAPRPKTHWVKILGDDERRMPVERRSSGTDQPQRLQPTFGWPINGLHFNHRLSLTLLSASKTSQMAVAESRLAALSVGNEEDANEVRVIHESGVKGNHDSGEEGVRLFRSSYAGGLLLHGAQPEDSGVYECQSQNHLGVATARINLDVLGGLRSVQRADRTAQ